MNKYSILLFSKYSIQSKKLLDVMSQSKINFKDVINLTPVCIDSKSIRDKIKDNKLNIRYVPCILTVYSHGVVEKYDGENAFNWVNDIIASLAAPQPPPASIFHNNDEDDEEEEEFVKPKVILKKKKGKRPKVTSVEELDDLPDGDEIPSRGEEVVILPMRSKKKKLRLKDKGNYEDPEEDDGNDGDEYVEERIVDKTTTARAINNKSTNNTLSKAKELAKLRENDIALIEKPKL